jgi:hypothetical protein
MLTSPCPDRRSHAVGIAQRRLAEEVIAALALKLEQLALDRADARLGDIAVGGRQLAGALAAIGEQLCRSSRLSSSSPSSSADGKAMLSTPSWSRSGPSAARAAAGPSRNGGADRVALLAVQIPEGDRKSA